MGIPDEDEDDLMFSSPHQQQKRKEKSKDSKEAIGESEEFNVHERGKEEKSLVCSLQPISDHNE